MNTTTNVPTTDEEQSCSCCGADLGDQTRVTNPGMCQDCGGKKRSRNTRRRIGWAGEMFYDARIRVIREKLSPENLANFNGRTYEWQCAFVAKMIEKGKMI